MKDDQQVIQIVNGIVDYLQSIKALDLLPQVAEKLTNAGWVKLDPELALVYCRIKLSPGQIKMIKTWLSRLYGRPIRIKTFIDPSIIAGLKINIGGKTIDATINRRLEDLKQQVIYD